MGEIGPGLLILAGVEKADGQAQVDAAAQKLSGLRCFEDENGLMNLDVRQAGGSFLVVSQFTLAGSLAKGRRPSFDKAAPPEIAEPPARALEGLGQEPQVADNAGPDGIPAKRAPVEQIDR